jgi:hypothetical protein
MTTQFVPFDCNLTELTLDAIIAVPAVVLFTGTTLLDALTTVVVPTAAPAVIQRIWPG